MRQSNNQEMVILIKSNISNDYAINHRDLLEKLKSNYETNPKDIICRGKEFTDCRKCCFEKICVDPKKQFTLFDNQLEIWQAIIERLSEVKK